MEKNTVVDIPEKARQWINTNTENLTGRKFGHWLVLSYSHVTGRYSHYWNCLCSCGTLRKVIGTRLRTGGSRSCGCQRESLIKKNTKHGMSDTKFYDVWSAMKARCENENNEGYKNYGGRGIRVCRRWRKFTLFYVDMYASYSPGLTLERINVNKGYSPVNCKWIPKREQSSNTRKSIKVVFRGKKYSLIELCDLHNIKTKIVRQRLGYGWTVEDAILKPIKRR